MGYQSSEPLVYHGHFSETAATLQRALFALFALQCEPDVGLDGCTLSEPEAEAGVSDDVFFLK